MSSVGTGGGFRVQVDGVPSGADAYTTGSSTLTTVTPTDLTDITELFVNIVSYSPENLDFAVDNIVLTTTSVPEPFSMALLGTGLVGLGIVRYRLRG